ncbi:stAR-related lipid transfer protein 5 [Camelus ferus]|nr:stAR-related lipid transfer protein 5 [Camelus ferus]
MDPALAAQISEAVAEKMLQYRRDKSGWKICREGGWIVEETPLAVVSFKKIYRACCVHSDPGRYRGEGIVNGTPEQVWDCVKPLAGTLRDKWDENVAGFEIIESITDTLCICRTTTPSAAMKLISPRDFVDLALAKKYEDGTISSNGAEFLPPPQFVSLPSESYGPCCSSESSPQGEAVGASTCLLAAV